MPQLKVTFRNPVIVDTDHLGELLIATNYPSVSVEPIAADEAPVAKTRKPRGPNKPKEVPAVTTQLDQAPRPDLVGGAAVSGFDRIAAATAAQQGAVVEGTATEVKEAEPPKRRGRKSAAAAEAASTSAPAQATTTTAATADPTPAQVQAQPAPDTGLMTRFSALVEKDYEAGLKLLTDFGVGKFSDITPDKQAAFSKALTEAGV